MRNIAVEGEGAGSKYAYDANDPFADRTVSSKDAFSRRLGFRSIFDAAAQGKANSELPMQMIRDKQTQETFEKRKLEEGQIRQLRRSHAVNTNFASRVSNGATDQGSPTGGMTDKLGG